MCDCENTPWGRRPDTDTCRRCDGDKAVINVDPKVADWMNTVAENHHMEPDDFADTILRHGLVNSEEILYD